MNLNPFHYAMSLLDTLYEITISEDQFEEIALVGWNHIGNKIVRMYKYRGIVDECNLSLDLPCNCYQIEAVTSDFEEWNYSTNDTPNGDINSAYVEAYIENRKSSRSPLYINGKFIKYEQVGNKLYFDKPYGYVNILYKGIVLDDDGLPELTDKEALALATYCAYVIKFKEGLKTNNPTIIRMSDKLLELWHKQIDQARVGYYMTQNEWDQVLDAKTSWNRKEFGKSLKLYK